MSDIIFNQIAGAIGGTIGGLTTAGTSVYGGLGGYGTSVGEINFSEYQRLAQSALQFQKAVPAKPLSFLEELRAEIKSWHGELRAA